MRIALNYIGNWQINKSPVKVIVIIEVFLKDFLFSQQYYKNPVGGIVHHTVF